MKPQQPMYYRNPESTPNYSAGQQQYPGAAPPDPYLLPEQATYSAYLPAAPTSTPASSSSGLLSKLDFNQIKSTIDRLGGVDGILATVSKVQKIMQTVQQFAPMVKMLIPKLGAKSSDSGDDDDYEDYPRRRRRRRSGSRHGSRRGSRYGSRHGSGYSSRYAKSAQSGRSRARRSTQTQSKSVPYSSTRRRSVKSSR